MIPIFEIDFTGTGSNFQVVSPPRNYDDIELELSFTSEFPSATIQSIAFEWVNEMYTKIWAYYQAGLTGGTGIGEGLPLQIYVQGSNPKLYIFQGVIDLPNESTTFENGIISAPIKKIGSIDWFNDNATGVSFVLLATTAMPGSPWAWIGPPGSGCKYKYKEVPYTVTVENETIQAVILLMQGGALVNQFIKAAGDTVKSYEKILADLGVTATAAYAPVGVIQIVCDALWIVLDTFYDAILISSTVGIVESLLNMIGLTKKYKYAMRFNDLVNAGLDYLNSQGALPANITYKSTIFTDPLSPYYNTTIMPRKVLKENSQISLSVIQNVKKNTGVITRGSEVTSGGPVPNAYGYFDGNLKKLLDDVMQIPNAKGYMIGNVYNLEEIHHFNKIANFTVPNTGLPGFNLNWPAPFGTNWRELASYYRIAFALDSQDERTSIVYTGTECSVTIQPNIVKNTLNLLPPPDVDITFPFAMAKRKEYLSVMEVVLDDVINFLSGADAYAGIRVAYNDLAKVINAIAKVFGSKPAITPLPAWNPVNASALKGCLEVSSDTWNEPKIFIGTPVSTTDTPDGTEWQIDPNNGANNNGIWVNPNVPASTPFKGEGWFSTFALMQQFHGLNLSTRGDQWLKYPNKTFPLCPSDFIKILNNNVFTTADGKYGKFDTLKWHLRDEVAKECNYRVNSKYTNNLTETLSVDGN